MSIEYITVELTLVVFDGLSPFRLRLRLWLYDDVLLWTHKAIESFYTGITPHKEQQRKAALEWPVWKFVSSVKIKFATSEVSPLYASGNKCKRVNDKRLAPNDFLPCHRWKRGYFEILITIATDIKTDIVLSCPTLASHT